MSARGQIRKYRICKSWAWIHFTRRRAPVESSLRSACKHPSHILLLVPFHPSRDLSENSCQLWPQIERTFLAGTFNHVTFCDCLHDLNFKNLFFGSFSLFSRRLHVNHGSWKLCLSGDPLYAQPLEGWPIHSGKPVAVSRMNKWVERWMDQWLHAALSKGRLHVFSKSSHSLSLYDLGLGTCSLRRRVSWPLKKG